MPKKEIVSELTSNTFNEFVNDKEHVLSIVDFYAEWCMPCVMMAPIIEKIAGKNKKVKFGKVNVDENGELANQFEVSSIPCLVFFKNGEEVDRVANSLAEDLLNEKILDYIKESR